jgi:3-hydroxyacyl-[acyl-carrier-protein] dehydratase
MRHYWVDHVSIVEPGVRATARKAVGWAEDHFADHFPGNPVLPGVYIIEGIAQAAGALLGRASNWADFALMVSVDRARFSSFVRPGEVVEYRIEVEEHTAAMARVGAVATVGDRRVAQVRLSFQIRPLATMIPEPHRAAWIHTLGLLFDKDLGKDPLADA